MKIVYKLSVLTIIDFGIIWLWVYQIDPDPSISIAIVLLVPLIITINLVIAGILFLLKKKEYSNVFLINSIICSILMYYIFHWGIIRHQDRIVESWEFQKSDTIFSLIRWKETNEFSISYTLYPGSSWGFLDGKCEYRNGMWILTADSLKMKIINDNKLIGFRNSTDTILMKKN